MRFAKPPDIIAIEVWLTDCESVAAFRGSRNRSVSLRRNRELAGAMLHLSNKSSVGP